MIKDSIGWKSRWRIDKFIDLDGRIAAFLKNGGSVEEAVERFGGYLGGEEFEGNIILNEGFELLLDIIAGLDTTSNKWDSSNAYIGVGDGTTAEDETQTGLQGANKTYKGMDSGYPQRSGQTLEFRATFGGTEANHDWKEFTVANGNSDDATNLNRKVEDKGTKSSGETWTCRLQITKSS